MKKSAIISGMPPFPDTRQHPEPRDDRPWWRYGWVWFLIGIPATSVIAGAVMLWIAVTQSDSLVADDYYRQGRAINQRLEKDQTAVMHGIRLTSRIEARPSGDHRIEVRFESRDTVQPPAFIRLRLSHPTLDRMDILATLTRSSGLSYTSDVPGIMPGRWYVQMEDDLSNWRVKATWFMD
jgi:hypothetical protein